MGHEKSENSTLKLTDSVHLSDLTQKKYYGKIHNNIFVEHLNKKTRFGKLGELNEINSNQLSIDKSGWKLDISMSSSYSNTSFDSGKDSIWLNK